MAQKNTIAPADARPAAITDLMSEAMVLTEEDVRLAEKAAELHKRIVLASIKSTRPTNWTDYDGQPYCDAKGCEEIAGLWAISTGETKIEEKHGKDSRGEYIVYICSGAVSKKGRVFNCIGKSWTRKPFFGRKDKQDRPLDDIDLPSVQMDAFTNWFNNAIKRSLGIRGITWVELEEVFGADAIKWIRENNSVSHSKKDIDKTASDNSETAKKRADIARAIMVLAHGDPEKAPAILLASTTWKKGNETIQGRGKVKELSEKQVGWQHPILTKQAADLLEKMPPDERAALVKTVDEFLTVQGKA